MDQTKDYEKMLEMLSCPAFTVAEGNIVCCNQAARQLLLEPGTAVKSLFATGEEEYEQLTEGKLYLGLRIQDTSWGAHVTRMTDHDLFCLEQTGLTPELKAMALLCSQLRVPLCGVSVAAEKLCTKNSDYSSVMNHGLSQIVRILNNVSNATMFSLDEGTNKRTQNICAVLDELLQECKMLLQEANIRLDFTLPETPIYTLLDLDMLRQAVYSLLNNAAKFTPQGGIVHVILSQNGNTLRLSVCDHGTGMPESVRGNLFSRYTREPSIEDGLFGVGLGMALVRAAALAHGGTVLVDSTKDISTRVTMTLAIRHQTVGVLHSVIKTLSTPSDDALTMLSNVLPDHLYQK